MICVQELKAGIGDMDPGMKAFDGYQGHFHCAEKNGPAVRKPVLRRVGMDAAIATLWKVSEDATGIPLDVTGAKAAAGA